MNQRIDATPRPGPPKGLISLLSLQVGGAWIREMPLVTDPRGSLTFGECDQHLPFVPKRYFLVFDVPSEEVRGEHAHRSLHQLLVCVAGSCSVMVDDGQNRTEVSLDRPNLALYLPPMVWAAQYGFTRDAVLLVLASDIYRSEDYIRDYQEFLRELHRATRSCQ